MVFDNTGAAGEHPTEAIILAGANVGPYCIEGPLGKGGMGDVYRARDTRLGRSVALKFLSEQMMANQSALERFRREGQAICTLNHPNVCTVYDIGELSGRPYLVMEMLDGQTLKDRIAEGPFSNHELLAVAIPLLEALEAAHGAGIIHRDIKPANIFITKSGIVKILDFGLAKAPGMEGLQDAFQDGLTLPNTTVGTLHYMSPEQASGKSLDMRSDLFAAGVVLYEMATRTLPFAADGWGETVSAILNRTPKRASEVRPDLMTEIDRVIDRSLQKNPAARYQSAAEMRADLLRAKRTIDSQEFMAVQPANSARKWKAVLPAASLAALLIATLGLWYLIKGRHSVTLPSEFVQLTDFNDYASAPALSSDGKMVAFMRGGEKFLNTNQIYVKILPDGQSTQLTNSPEPKYGLTFTPDGSRVAFTTLAFTTSIWTTYTVPVTGGATTRLMTNAAGMSWIGEHQLLFSEIRAGTPLHMGVVTAEENRANERRIYFPVHERAMAHYSYLSPDRKNILIVEMDGTGSWLPCRLVPMDGSSSGRVVGPNGACTSAAWSPDGQWMFFNVATKGVVIRGPIGTSGANHIYRQRFPDGAPGLITSGPSEEEGIALSRDGRFLVSSVGLRKSSVWLHDRAGDQLVSQEGSGTLPKITSDGKWLYYLLERNQSGLTELWRTELSTGKSAVALTGVSMRDFDISQDGQQVAYSTLDADRTALIAPLDGSGPPRLIVKGGDTITFGQANEIIFRNFTSSANYVERIDTDGKNRRRLFDSPIAELVSTSPDGNWLVLAGSPSMGKSTFAISRKDQKRVMFCQGICLPKWSPNGKFLFITTKRDPTSNGVTFVTQTGPDGMIALSPNGISTNDEAPLPGARLIRQGWVAPGLNDDTYAYERSEFQGNLYRIPIH